MQSGGNVKQTAYFHAIPWLSLLGLYLHSPHVLWHRSQHLPLVCYSQTGVNKPTCLLIQDQCTHAHTDTQKTESVYKIITIYSLIFSTTLWFLHLWTGNYIQNYWVFGLHILHTYVVWSESTWDLSINQQCISHVRCYLSELATLPLATQALFFQVDWMFCLVFITSFVIERVVVSLRWVRNR
jgi:hypothetical protein